MDARQRIDAHHHLWSLAGGLFPWMERHKDSLNMDRIIRPCEAPEFARILARNGFVGSVLVEADPNDRATHDILSIARDTPFVAGTVGWADIGAPDAPARIAALSMQPGLRGLRLWPLAQPDPAWILDPRNAAALDAIAHHDLTVDWLARPAHLAPLSRLLDTRPELRVALCHVGKPEITRWTARDAAFRDWATGLRRLADQGCVAKLSGLVTECGDAWTTETIRPYVETVVETFGPSRVLWGSDWPVIDRAGGFEKWLHAIEAIIAPLLTTDREAIFGGAARAFYRL